MSLQSVRQFFAEHAPDIEIIELNQSTAPSHLPLPHTTLSRGKLPKRCRSRSKIRLY